MRYGFGYHQRNPVFLAFFLPDVIILSYSTTRPEEVFIPVLTRHAILLLVLSTLQVDQTSKTPKRASATVGRSMDHVRLGYCQPPCRGNIKAHGQGRQHLIFSSRGFTTHGISLLDHGRGGYAPLAYERLFREPSHSPPPSWQLDRLALKLVNNSIILRHNAANGNATR